ncbi:MAG TPA: hypothetical protein VJI15_02390 [Candidatus Nanoarchaeia archaeon]|nr:hypothetical protein [Candidatus Nanoarchaeia archaeon]
MNQASINLEVLASDGANFAHSEREPTSRDHLIIGPRPFMYRWTVNNGMEILTFEDPTRPSTAKLFRYDQAQMRQGIDLEHDTPVAVGDQVVTALQQYGSR